MNKSVFFTLALIALTKFYTFAQEMTAEKIIESIIETHLANSGEDASIGLIIEDLEGFIENPLNLNSAKSTDLVRLHALNEIQIERLLQYVRIFGPVYSIYELKTIPGFHSELLMRIEPFIEFGLEEVREMRLSGSSKKAKQMIVLRGTGISQQARGYLSDSNSIPAFEGNRFRYYSRYKIESPERFSAGFTGEKDPGETFFRASNKHGFDFYSAHVSFTLNSWINKIIIGDFLIRSGQGLVLWQGFANSKSLYTLNVFKTGQGVHPFTSLDENLFFRGIATGLNLGKTKINLFYSRNRSDASIRMTGSGNSEFSGFITSGYHRTASERANENSLNNTNLGAVGSWNHKQLKLGLTAHVQQFDKILMPTDALYNKFRFFGKRNYTVGVDYHFSKGKYQLLGEAAMSQSGGTAFLQKVIANLNEQLGLSAVFRHSDRDYHALWAQSFGETHSARNETGLYIGTRILPVKRVTLSAYTDYFKSSWLGYSTASPSRGYDVFVQTNVIMTENVDFYLRYKREEKELKKVVQKKVENGSGTIQRLRLHLEYKPSKALTLKTRFEGSNYRSEENENGIMICQDVQTSLRKIPLSTSVRIAWINTDSYKSRIYAYENDLLYTYSIPAYYGKGIRTYLNLKYEIASRIHLWFKVSNTTWNDRNSIGSGFSEISGKHKTELKLQLRLKI